MKNLIIALVALIFLSSVPSAMASGNYRAALDRQWKRVEAWQERESAKFRAIEREAAREIESLGGESRRFIPIWEIYPPCGQ